MAIFRSFFVLAVLAFALPSAFGADEVAERLAKLLADGKPISAAGVAAETLNNPRASSEAVYLGAEAAAESGDAKLAAQRFRKFLGMSGVKHDERYYRAAAYVRYHGASIESVRALHEISSALVADALEGFFTKAIDNSQTQFAVDLIGFVHDSCTTDACVINRMLRRLYERWGQIGAQERTDLSKAVVRLCWSDLPGFDWGAYWTRADHLYGALPPHEKARVYLRLVEIQKRCPPDQSFLNALVPYLESLPGEKRKEAGAAVRAAVEGIGDIRVCRNFIQEAVCSRPDLFPYVYSTDELAAFYNAFAKERGATSREARDLCWRIVDCFLANRYDRTPPKEAGRRSPFQEEWHAFGNACRAELHAEFLDRYGRDFPGDAAKVLRDGVFKLPKEGIARYERVRGATGFLRLAGATNFWTNVMRHEMRLGETNLGVEGELLQGFLPDGKTVALVKEMFDEVGATPLMASVVQALGKDKRFKDNAAVKSLAGRVKADELGRDAFLTYGGIVAAGDRDDDRGRYAERLENARKFFKAYTGTIPSTRAQAKTVEEVLAYTVARRFVYAADGSGNHEQKIKALGEAVEAFGDRLETDGGGMWPWLYAILHEHARHAYRDNIVGGPTAQALRRYLAGCRKCGGKLDGEARRRIGWVTPADAKGTETPLYEMIPDDEPRAAQQLFVRDWQQGVTNGCGDFLAKLFDAKAEWSAATAVDFIADLRRAEVRLTPELAAAGERRLNRVRKATGLALTGETHTLLALTGWQAFDAVAKESRSRTFAERLQCARGFASWNRERGSAAQQVAAYRAFVPDLPDAKDGDFAYAPLGTWDIYRLCLAAESEGLPAEDRAFAERCRSRLAAAVAAVRLHYAGESDEMKRCVTPEVEAFLRGPAAHGEKARALQMYARLADPLGNSVFWNRWGIDWKILNAATNTTPEIQYAYIDRLLKGRDNDYVQRVRAETLQRMLSLRKCLPDVIPVPKSSPLHPLYVAQRALARGNTLEAWKGTREKLDVLGKDWKEFDFDFVTWALDMARKQKLYDSALKLVSTLWLSEDSFEPELAARLALAKGDVYRDMKNFPAARIEYESLDASPRYRKTVCGRKAKYRLAELKILAEDFASAEAILERLTDAETVGEQAEAWYLLARLAFAQKEYGEARKDLAQAFRRDHGHVEARLLKGEIDLATKNLTDTSVEIGPAELNLVAIPGEDVNFRIQDSNLAVVRGGKSIPVRVTTSVGGDAETLELMPAANDPTLFTGKLRTALGVAKRDNLLLEVSGADKVVYQIDPAFQKANGLNYGPKHLEVKSAAKLYVSSTRILSDAEMEEQRVNEALGLAAGRKLSEHSRTIRPGNPIHVRVVDPDCSVSTNAADTVAVDVETSSGDLLRGFVLTETGPSTGVFEGQIPTGVPFPNATASDVKEGCDPNAAINRGRKGGWESLADGMGPKSLSVDLMTSYLLSNVTVRMKGAGSVSQLRITGSLDADELVLGEYPASAAVGGIQVRTLWNEVLTREDLFFSRFRRASVIPVNVKQPSFLRDGDRKLSGHNGWLATEATGKFWIAEPTDVDFKFISPGGNSAWAFLYIDGKRVFGGGQNETWRHGSVPLARGVHQLKIYWCSHNWDTKLVLGRILPDGSTAELPAEWFDPKASPEFEAALRPLGRISRGKNAFDLVLDAPARLRKLNVVFEKFTGSDIVVEKVLATDAAGRRVLPADDDFSTGRENDRLEIASGDEVKVTYEDRIRLDDARSQITEAMRAQFHDARFGICYERIRTLDNGSHLSEYIPAVRALPGDSLQVMLEDWDVLSDDLEQKVPVELRTTGGERLTLNLSRPALNHTDYVETFTLGDRTRGNTIKVRPGDVITAVFLDRENNRPGVPVERTASVACATDGAPALAFYRTVLRQVEDRSEKALAKVRQMRDRGDRRADIRIFKDEIEAERTNPAPTGRVQVVNAKTPLLFELRWRGAARHLESTVNVEILTDTERKTAAAEGREARPKFCRTAIKNVASLAREKGYSVVARNDRRTASEMLADGSFTGLVRLQLGAPGDDLNDRVMSDEVFSLMNASPDAEASDADRWTVPTVIVAGSDALTLTARDANGAVVATARAKLGSDGSLGLYDRTFASFCDTVHIGQDFYISVSDPDRDATDALDTVEVTAKASSGDETVLKLSETLPHSGVFTGRVRTEVIPKPGADGNPPAKAAGTIRTGFGDTVAFAYRDERPLVASPTGTLAQATGTIAKGADGELAAFTKTYKDPEMAVKTGFLMAEALFEMAKSHRQFKKPDLAAEEVARGKRILEEVMRDHPNTTLKAQGDFLLANLAQNLNDFPEAVNRYTALLAAHPDSEYAPKSQFQKAVCLEKMGPKFASQACEEFVKVTYLYPENALAADAKLRLANFYYKNKRYVSAAKVFEKFQENHAEHPLAPKALFLAAQSYLRESKDLAAKFDAERRDPKARYQPRLGSAVADLKLLVERYQDDKDLRAEAMYWLGDALYQQAVAQPNHDRYGLQQSYRWFKQLSWDYPESKWAKMARGRIVELEN